MSFNRFLWPSGSWKQMMFLAEVFVEMMRSRQEPTVGLPDIPTLALTA